MAIPKIGLLDSYKVWDNSHPNHFQHALVPSFLITWAKNSSSCFPRCWQILLHVRCLWVVDNGKNQTGGGLNCTRDGTKPPNLVLEAYHG